MPIAVRSFAKINIGLRIGAAREDGFHELRTIYQTIGLHDIVRVDVARGTGIEIRSRNPKVPQDESNTCYRMAERVLRSLKQRNKVVIQIEKNLPIQGGLGAASSNAVATLLGIERALKAEIPPDEKLRMAAEVGSDVPLFLLGGTILGMGRGEQVYPLPDLPSLPLVITTPSAGISTPKAFQDWDTLQANGSSDKDRVKARLTAQSASDTMNMFSQSLFAWLTPAMVNGSSTGVSTRGGDRAEAPLLDLVRAGIENDFERVVFPQHPELREAKRVLEGEGARYASLSGSGSSVYGFFDSQDAAEKAAGNMGAKDGPAQATKILSRSEYWKQLFVN